MEVEKTIVAANPPLPYSELGDTASASVSHVHTPSDSGQQLGPSPVDVPTSASQPPVGTRVMMDRVRLTAPISTGSL